MWTLLVTILDRTFRPATTRLHSRDLMVSPSNLFLFDRLGYASNFRQSARLSGMIIAFE